MKNIAVIYGSTGGTTQNVAKSIGSHLDAKVINVDRVTVDELGDYDVLILGTSTWGVGDIQDDWEVFLPQLKDAPLDGKTVALFGLGDSMGYPDTFVDGMGEIYEAIQDKGCKIIGEVNTCELDFDDSRAFIDDKFIGLPLDEDNHSDMIEVQLEAWVESLKQDI